MSTCDRNLSWLPLTKVEADLRCQSRAVIHQAKVEEYGERIQAGDEFPPITVFHELGELAYWLADGWHRYLAHKLAKKKQILADIRPGGLRDAILYAVGANPTHGIHRSREDKRKAVMMLLHDDEWKRWSDREIARRAHVTHPFVAAIRLELSGNITRSKPRIAVRGGKEYSYRPPARTAPAKPLREMSPAEQLEARQRAESKPKMVLCPTCNGVGEVPA